MKKPIPIPTELYEAPSTLEPFEAWFTRPWMLPEDAIKPVTVQYIKGKRSVRDVWYLYSVQEEGTIQLKRNMVRSHRSPMYRSYRDARASVVLDKMTHVKAARTTLKACEKHLKTAQTLPPRFIPPRAS